MLLTEYDEEQHMRDTYKEGYEEGEQAGYSKGEQDGYNKLLKMQIQKKLERGKSINDIAEELEVDIQTVEEIMKSVE